MRSVLWISAIGAGLVILGLMLLWFLMDVLVRITARKKAKADAQVTDAAGETIPDLEHMQKAAAASTAVAIALLKSSFLSSDKRVDQCLTAWQNAHRYTQHNNLPIQSKPNRNDK